MSELTAEQIVKQKYPEAYCNPVMFRGRLRFKICVGIYSEQKSLSRAKGMQIWAWADAAKRLTESK